MAIGDAFIEVHADTDPFDREVRRDTDAILESIEDEMDQGGKDIGDELVDSIAKQVEKKGGKEIADAFEKSFDKEGWRDLPTFPDPEFSSGAGKRVGLEILDEITDAFDNANRAGGPIQKIGIGIADAIGAGFNISGRSPLIALLVPVIGAIVALVVGALQAVAALIAVLGTIPTLIAAIGLQVGVVALAFDGMGEAIGKALSAKTPKEFEQALKDLSPAAKGFVYNLLPVIDLFKELKGLVQREFFKPFGKVLPELVSVLRPILIKGFPSIARAMGILFTQLLDFFQSPSFELFLKHVFPQTMTFLREFGPKFITFLTGLIDIANASMPFLLRFGRIIGGVFDHIGQWLSDMADNPEFLAWLDDMADTLDSVVDLFFELMDFVKTFLDELNQAGGRSVIQEFADAFSMLVFFLQSPVGAKAMEGLVNFSIIAIRAITGLIIIILGLIALIQRAAEFWVWLGGVVAEFLTVEIPKFFEAARATIWGWILAIGRAIGGFFTVEIPKFFEAARSTIWGWILAVGGFFTGLAITIATKFTEIKDWIITKFEEAKEFVGTIPGKILGFFLGIGTLLFNAGQDLIGGFIEGAKSMVTGGALGDAMNWVLQRAADFFPGSPAKEGPFSGEGYVLLRGQRMMQDFAKGIQMATPELGATSIEAVSNIFVGAGAVRLGFEGALPTDAQAMATGNAAGGAFMDQLAVRNARLAVRSL